MDFGQLSQRTSQFQQHFVELFEPCARKKQQRGERTITGVVCYVYVLDRPVRKKIAKPLLHVYILYHFVEELLNSHLMIVILA